MNIKNKKGWYFGLGFLVVVAIVAVTVFLNRGWLTDWWRGMRYQPTAEMVQIRDALKLTDEGAFIFNASWPELNDSETFNQNCRSGEVTIAVLGCYTDNNIYIYNIQEEKLDGIRELTTAHELLHAVYARMPEEEKQRLVPLLEKVYAENEAVLKDDVETYAVAERMEELYTRAGTEIKKLPEYLEKHYAKYFENQDRVVSFYEKYIGKFKEIEARVNQLAAEMEELNGAIDAKTTEYEQRAGQLEVEITSFNACAETLGCFQSRAAFNRQRAALLAEQNNLGNLYQEIGGLVEEYNAKVEEYNKNIIEGRRLNKVVNSYEKTKDLDLAN